jgi:hypothetical protein
MRLIYVAGPYTAKNGWLIHENIHDAESAAAKIFRDGRAVAVVPHSIGAHFNGFGTPEYWYRATLALMIRCSAVLALPTWESSKGATLEIQVADRARLPVFYSHEELFAWLDGKSTGTTHGQRGTLGELLAGLPQTLPLRFGARTQEIREWRKEADDGLIYQAYTMSQIRLTSSGQALFQEVPGIRCLICAGEASVYELGGKQVCVECGEMKKIIVLPARAEHVEVTVGFAPLLAQSIAYHAPPVLGPKFKFKTEPPKPTIGDLKTAMDVASPSLLWLVTDCAAERKAGHKFVNTRRIFSMDAAAVAHAESLGWKGDLPTKPGWMNSSVRDEMIEVQILCLAIPEDLTRRLETEAREWQDAVNDVHRALKNASKRADAAEKERDDIRDRILLGAEDPFVHSLREKQELVEAQLPLGWGLIEVGDKVKVAVREQGKIDRIQHELINLRARLREFLA